MAKLDRLESLIKSSTLSNKARAGTECAAQRRKNSKAGTASDTVYQIIKRSQTGMGFADIRAKTDYGEKKVRNAIYRLHNMGKITRKSRGLYVVT